MKWWRIETDNDGKVVSCEEVETGGIGAGFVFFVRCPTRYEARQRAWNAYCKIRQRARHERLTAEGKCPHCGRPNDRRASRCSICLEEHNVRSRRKRAIARGEVVAIPSRAEAVASRASDERRALRLAVLTEVQENFQRSGTVGQFVRWLAERIHQETAEQKPRPRRATA